MEIVVKMDESEFQEFMAYRADSKKYEAALVRIKNTSVIIAQYLLGAVEPTDEKFKEWKIISQEHMGDAVSFADKLLEALGE